MADKADTAPSSSNSPEHLHVFEHKKKPTYLSLYKHMGPHLIFIFFPNSSFFYTHPFFYNYKLPLTFRLPKSITFQRQFSKQALPVSVLKEKFLCVFHSPIYLNILTSFGNSHKNTLPRLRNLLYVSHVRT